MKQNSSFTLIELFISIAIVAILLAISLPAFLKALTQAKYALCRANLRQIGLAMKQYAMDYDDFYPLNGRDISDSGTLVLQGSPKKPVGFNRLIFSGYLKDLKSYKCPATTTSSEGIRMRASRLDPLMPRDRFYGLRARDCDYTLAGPILDGSSEIYGKSDSAVSSDKDGSQNGRSNDNKPNHHLYGNILFHDGHVSGFSGADWLSTKNRGGSNLLPSR